MKEVIKFDSLLNCIGKLDTEEGFEKFDEIYDAIKDGSSIFKMEDIKELCLILRKPSENMEPHQFIKIEKMTYLTINEYGIEGGFKELLEGLMLLVDYNPIETQGYLNMLMNSYSDEEISIFSKIAQSYPSKFKEKISKLIIDLMESKPQVYENKVKAVLDKINV